MNKGDVVGAALQVNKEDEEKARLLEALKKHKKEKKARRSLRDSIDESASVPSPSTPGTPITPGGGLILKIRLGPKPSLECNHS